MVKYQSGQCKIKCPFCGERVVTAFHKPSCRQASRTSISAGVKYTYQRKAETYEVCGGCPNCGTSQKEVQKAFDTGVTRELSHEERLKKLKEAGLPLRIATKHKKEATP